MRALTRGERNASVGVVAGLLGVLAMLVSTLLLTLSYRSQLIDLRETLEQRCAARQVVDQKINSAAEGDAKFYGDLLDVAERAEGLRVEPLTPEMRALVDEQKQIVADAQRRKLALVNQGVLGGCSQYKAVAQ